MSLPLKGHVVQTTGAEPHHMRQSIQSVIDEERTNGDPFFLIDIGDVHRKHQQFRDLLPRVIPFYAVKCNPDPIILRTLVSLGLSFDCASQGEISAMLDLGVHPDNIIYANPCKPVPHLKFARKMGVKKMTFDNEEELYKVKEHHPEAELLLRILADDSKSVCRLGLKFGAAPEQAFGLLTTAKALDLNMVGVSFHVGSGCKDATAFSDAVSRARRVFDDAQAIGYDLSILDIGGGFPGTNEFSKPVEGDVSFQEIVGELQASLDLHFPEESGIKIIAEPGRYYVSSAAHLAVNIIAKRRVNRDAPEVAEEGGLILAGDSPSGNDNPAYMYYVNDGVYGSFNCILFDHAIVHSEPLTAVRNPDVLFEASVWGPTCDSMDCIQRNVELPEMDVNDWIIFRDMGAYTMCAASTFNGFPKARLLYTFTPVSQESNSPEALVSLEHMQQFSLSV